MSARRQACDCLDPDQRRRLGREGTQLHPHAQDQNSPAWHRLLEVIEEAAGDQRKVFAPGQELGIEAWSQIRTLPSAIAKLTKVKHLQLYGSNLRSLPAEIGAMESLEIFTSYTSYNLHWFPYEITRCHRLKDSSVSTRAIYGNFKNKLPFPKLPQGLDNFRPETCSICNRPFGEQDPIQRWTTQRIASDTVPLLIHSCSQTCLGTLPSPITGNAKRPHRGSC